MHSRKALLDLRSSHSPRAIDGHVVAIVHKKAASDSAWLFLWDSA
jgi:hypothetical protein